uniref:C-type lectin domain-containing protein n=1 Tax=Rhabditophanes sp. KR3021 TaxID=114890 RepID=A0AC35UAG8_9BILA
MIQKDITRVRKIFVFVVIFFTIFVPALLFIQLGFIKQISSGKLVHQNNVSLSSSNSLVISSSINITPSYVSHPIQSNPQLGLFPNGDGNGDATRLVKEYNTAVNPGQNFEFSELPFSPTKPNAVYGKREKELLFGKQLAEIERKHRNHLSSLIMKQLTPEKDELQHCPYDNDFLLGINKKCYKIMIPALQTRRRSKECRLFSSVLARIVSDYDVYAIRKLFLRNANVRSIAIYGGFECTDINVCHNLKTRKEVKLSIQIRKEQLPCYGIFNVESAKWSCLQNSTSLYKMPYICEKKISYNLPECSNKNGIREYDNKCYSKNILKTVYSREVISKICKDFKMTLPIIEEEIVQSVVSNRARTLKSNIWIGLTCLTNRIEECVWSNGRNVSHHQFYPPDVHTKLASEKCVYFDYESTLWKFSDCDVRYGVMCQSDD